MFDGVDAVLFTHVGANLETGWGEVRGAGGLISVEYAFHGASAHAAAAPWRGRSALDAVELMNMGWNVRREHLRPEQRSHYIITYGGEQPNVVPALAKVWYYIRETDVENVRKNFGICNRIADGAAMMTDTEVTRRILGASWPRHYNGCWRRHCRRISSRSACRPGPRRTRSSPARCSARRTASRWG